MKTEIEKISAEEFGIDNELAKKVETAFLPKIKEREGYVSIYDEIIKSELSISTLQNARQLRLKLVKVRTGISDIHKSQKAFFLAAGKFVDAWKNKETLPLIQMEENLEKIEKHFENIEKEKIAKLQIERQNLVAQYSDVVVTGLGDMTQNVFDNYLTGLKVAFETKLKLEAEAKARIEAEAKAERERQIAIQKENEKLKKEAEKRQKELEIERAKQAEILAKAKAEAEKQAQIEAEKQAKIQAELKAKAEAERIEKEKIQAELKAKAEAEAKIKAEAERLERERKAAEKKAANAPDKQKLIIFAQTIREFPRPTLKSPDAIEILNNIENLLQKVDNYILEKTNSL